MREMLLSKSLWGRLPQNVMEPTENTALPWRDGVDAVGVEVLVGDDVEIVAQRLQPRQQVGVGGEMAQAEPALGSA